MLKKASVISSYTCLHVRVCPHLATSNTSPTSLPSPRAGPQPSRAPPSTWRSYADLRNAKGPDFRDNMHWPLPRDPSSTPTPYEVLNLDRGAAYSKHNFYELVKMYHPDRHGLEEASCGGISYVEKLERYRLVVLANDILSNPVKRRAYDSYGAGWGENARAVTRHSRGYYSTTGERPFGTGAGCDSSPFANATWEDWERWSRRSEDTGSKQADGGTYINPNAFASFVILMAVISGVAQATRAGQYSGSIEEKAQAFTEETSRFLSSRAEHYVENRLGTEGRIRHFLEKRDPSLYGLKDKEEETYRMHFSSHDVATSRAPPESAEPD